jgi:enoyl-CoA hydratase
MPEKNLTYSVQRDDAGTVATVTLERAECLDVAGKHELNDLFTRMGDDETVRVVILAGGHPEALLVDVAELAHMTATAALAYSRAGQELMSVLEALPVPVIAAVSGPALGGGCELVLACDLAVCSTEATFGQIEANGGVVPAFGGTWRLARRVGYQRACQLIFTAGIVSADLAREYGLVLDIHSQDDLMPRCLELASQIASTSRASVAEAKRILTGSWGRGPAMANQMEQASFAGLFATEDQQRRMDAFLAEHRS